MDILDSVENISIFNLYMMQREQSIDKADHSFLSMMF